MERPNEANAGHVHVFSRLCLSLHARRFYRWDVIWRLLYWRPD